MYSTTFFHVHVISKTVNQQNLYKKPALKEPVQIWFLCVTVVQDTLCRKYKAKKEIQTKLTTKHDADLIRIVQIHSWNKLFVVYTLIWIECWSMFSPFISALSQNHFSTEVAPVGTGTAGVACSQSEIVFLWRSWFKKTSCFSTGEGCNWIEMRSDKLWQLSK